GFGITLECWFKWLIYDVKFVSIIKDSILPLFILIFGVVLGFIGSPKVGANHGHLGRDNSVHESMEK
ncbi:hypothetical protein HAX54_051648, partial [Datura stramonium]|nr:hypothetical protein [Datura stramonium]